MALISPLTFGASQQGLVGVSLKILRENDNCITYTSALLLVNHVGPVNQISWSVDSRLLLNGSKDPTLKVWDFRTQKLKEELPGHADEVFAVDWSLDWEKVASGGTCDWSSKVMDELRRKYSASENQVSSTTTSGLRGLPFIRTEAMEDVTTTLLTDIRNEADDPKTTRTERREGLALGYELVVLKEKSCDGLNGLDGN
ncbi:hypothetical protein RJ639_036849 [Escallonia herrerae]|uniref:Uncharacterized protein n=1 Tax=Escallonia herrerae TaxID=1293975 RepID=A0AA89B664_9ASTE|nr:hypothetical protein RJ639_036849 [Escallonia herrerae]